MSNSLLAPTARTTNIVTQTLEDELLIYDLVTDKAFCLNETSASIWLLCDGNRSISEITVEMRLRFDTSVNQDLILLGLQNLDHHNLINVEDRLPSLSRVSRRRLIREIGFASLIMIPIVSSVIAPLATKAASGCPDPNNNTNSSPNGCNCNGSNDCVSSCCGFSPAPGNICVTANSVTIGSGCRAACECASGCCGLGFACVPNNGASAGSPCRVNCDCVNSCSGNVCT